MLESLNCINCGASLTPAGSELACQYCGSTHRHSRYPPLACLVDDPQGRELARIDQEWEAERQPYLWTNGDGTCQPPTILGVLGGGLVYLLFMAFYNAGAWAAAADMAENADGLAFSWAPYLGLPLLGVIFTGVGFALLGRQLKQAWDYRLAERRYLRRRAAVCGALPPLAIPIPAIA